MKRHPHWTTVYLRLTGTTLDPAAVTAALGLIPTRTWKRGDLRPGRRHPSTFGSWNLEPSGSRLTPFAAQLDQLLMLLDALPVDFAAWCAQHEITSAITVYSRFAAHQVGFVLERNTMRRLAALDLAIDFDLYPHGWLVPMRPYRRFRG